MKKIAAWLVATAVIVWLAAAGPVRAQQPPNPYYSQSPYMTVQAGVPYPGYVYAPGAGPGLGAAAVIGAGTQRMTGVQQTYLGREDVKRAKLDNKRAAFDEWKYEQANTPTTEDYREQDRAAQLRRSRNDPPVTEIWSGQALNVLLKDLQRLQANLTHTETAMLNPEVLKRINITGSRNDASLGLLREDGRLQWPYPLRAPLFDEDRKEIDQQMLKAIDQARSGAPSFQAINDLTRSVQRLLTHLKQQVRDMPSNQWTEAKRYVDQLQAGVRTLQDPGVANYFNGSWRAKGNTVEELVRNMTTQGLRFAAATQGDETAYQSLYQDLITYDTAVGQRMMRADMTAMSNQPATKRPARQQ